MESKIWPYACQDCLEIELVTGNVSLKSPKGRCPPSKAVSPDRYLSSALGNPNGLPARKVLCWGEPMIGLGS